MKPQQAPSNFELTIKQGNKECTYVLKDEKWRYDRGINCNVEDEKENREEKLQQDQKDIEELHEKLEKKRKELDKLEYEIKQLNLRKTIRMIEYMKSNEEFDKLKSQIK